MQLDLPTYLKIWRHMWMFLTILNKKTILLWKVQVHNPWCSFGAKKFLHSVKQIVIGRKTQQQCQFLPIFTFYQYIGKSDHLLALWIVLEKNPWRKWKFLDVKGQLISKCPFGVIVWTKIPTKNLANFCPRIWKVVKSTK